MLAWYHYAMFIRKTWIITNLGDWWCDTKSKCFLRCDDYRNFAFNALPRNWNNPGSWLGDLWRNSLYERQRFFSFLKIFFTTRARCCMGGDNYFIARHLSLCFSLGYNPKCCRIRSYAITNYKIIIIFQNGLLICIISHAMLFTRKIDRFLFSI